MRPLKMLFQIVKEDITNRRDSGKYFFMCNSIKLLYDRGEIDEQEEEALLGYLGKNKPEGIVNGGSWFEPNDFKSRINWLNEQINKL